MRQIFIAQLLFVFACAGMLGCASTPEPKPIEEEETAKPAQEDAGDEDIAPLSEADAMAAADAGKLADDEKDAPLPAPGEADPDPAAEAAKVAEPDELALGEETSALLSAAVQAADSDVAGALKLVEQAASSNPKCVQCLYNKGVLLERQTKMTKAVAAYRQVLALSPAHLATIINLSNLYLRDGKGSQARSVVSKAVRKAPKDLGLRNQLIVVLLAVNRVDDAVQQALGVLRMDERNAEAMIHLAMTYHLSKKFELAERILLKAQEIDKTSAVIPNRLAFVYLKMDNLSAAIAQLKKSVELDPKFIEAQNNLGVLYNRAHDYASAAEHFRLAIAQAPRFVDAYLNLGNALRGDRQFKEAEQAYKKVLELSPADKRVVLNLGLMYLDDEMPDYAKSKRFALAAEHLSRYQRAGGKYAKLAEYIKEAEKKRDRAIKSEQRRLKRESEKKLKEEQERKRKAAEEEAKRKAAEEEAKRKAAEEEAKRKVAEEEAKRKAAEDAVKRKAAEDAAKRKAAEDAVKRKAAEDAAKRKAAEDAVKRKAAEDAAKRKAAEAEAKRKAAESGAGKLGGGKDDEDGMEPSGKVGGGKDDEADEAPVDDGKLGGDEK